jgi:hypothetical protein
MGIYDRRELAHRMLDGYDASLVWDSASDEVVVICTLGTGSRLEFSPKRHQALDALRSPFEYAEQIQAGWRASPTVETCATGDHQPPQCRRRWGIPRLRCGDGTSDTKTEEQRR